MEQIAVRSQTPVNAVRQIAVSVRAADTISAAGLIMVLESHPGIVATRRGDRPDVLVFSTAAVTPGAIAELQALRPAEVPVVLLATNVPEVSLLTLIENGVVAIVDSKSAHGPELAEAVAAATKMESVMPKAVLRKLVQLVQRMQRDTLDPLGVNSVGLTDREVDILRLLADGAETAEIARQLTYSESTIKHVLHGLTTRYKFRNRVQAVAFALRAGVV
ncbi:response regulator transcription factor [Amycolatopsis sp. NPDC051903]|uniref:response regulator transcription factor n=1 Tax=Amycolatopsis sp. NPDC051903 TaxID=3363936 RepID=UPI00378A3B8F